MRESLENFYERNGVIPVAVLKKHLKQIAEGLVHMHRHGIAHLDLKCGNILMSESEDCKICDFAMAERITVTGGKFCGTPPFMAPEVWRESTNVSFVKIDMYAFGMIIYELLAGQLPWTRLYDGVDIDKWKNDIRIKVLEEMRPDVDRKRWDASLVELMTRCWSHDPNAGRTTPMLVLLQQRLLELSHRGC
jgi:serine/threonine protein kinase